MGLIPGWVVAASQHLGRVGSGRRDGDVGTRATPAEARLGRGEAGGQREPQGVGGWAEHPAELPEERPRLGRHPGTLSWGAGWRRVTPACSDIDTCDGPVSVGLRGPVLAASARGESAPLKCLGGGGRGGEAARLPHRGLESGPWKKPG